MATTTSTLNFEIIGNKLITDSFYTEDFTPLSKIELSFHNITTLSGQIPIAVDNLSSISKIIVKGTNANLRITANSVTINIPISGMLFYEVLEDYADTITDVYISTASTTSVDVEITIIGL